MPSKIFSGLKIIGCVLNLNSSGLVNYSAARHSKRHRKILIVSNQKLQRRTRSQNYVPGNVLSLYFQHSKSSFMIKEELKTFSLAFGTLHLLTRRIIVSVSFDLVSLVSSSHPFSLVFSYCPKADLSEPKSSISEQLYNK